MLCRCTLVLRCHHRGCVGAILMIYRYRRQRQRAARSRPVVRRQQLLVQPQHHHSGTCLSGCLHRPPPPHSHYTARPAPATPPRHVHTLLTKQHQLPIHSSHGARICASLTRCLLPPPRPRARAGPGGLQYQPHKRLAGSKQTSSQAASQYKRQLLCVVARGCAW